MHYSTEVRYSITSCIADDLILTFPYHLADVERIEETECLRETGGIWEKEMGTVETVIQTAKYISPLSAL